MGETMQAGRELDALVAERVFGWEWKLDQDLRGDEPVSEPYRVICDPRLWGDIPLGGPATGSEPARIDRPYGGQKPPHYSTDMTAAWAVVDEMHRRVFAHSCGDVEDNPWPDANYLTLSVLDGRGAAAATFTGGDFGDDEWHEHPERYGSARGESVAHAICLAALAALDSQPAPAAAGGRDG